MIGKIEVINGQYVKMNYQVAGTDSRMIALGIDRSIQWLLALLLLFLILELERFVVKPNEFLIVAVYVLIYTMNLILEYIWHGKTIGKKIMKIKVISDNCQPPSFQQCLLRWIIYPIDSMIIGLIFISKHGQRIGDMAAGCYVVNEKTKKLVNVSIEDDYRYVEKDYEPVYTQLNAMTEKEEALILKALYDPNYVSQQTEIARSISKKLDLEQQESNSERFLIQLYNDYKYLETKEN